jgi:hypothetical protein
MQDAEPTGEFGPGSSSSQIDRSAIEHFANIVFGYCQGFVPVRLLPEKNDTGQPNFLWLSTGEKLGAKLAYAAEVAATKGLACYVIPGVVGAHGHAKASHVVAMQTICVDIDTGDIAAKLKHLTDHLGPPSLVVESGGVTPEGQAKLHAYWKLTEPALDADVKKVCHLRHEIARKVGADPSFKSAHQPIRVAGTPYRKGGAQKLVTIQAANHYEYDLLELAEKIEAMPMLPYAARGDPEPVSGKKRNSKKASAEELFRRKIHENGADGTTRFEALSTIIGYWIRRCRDGHISREEAWEEIKAYNLANIVPPWPEDKLKKEFLALLDRDQQNHAGMGPIGGKPTGAPTWPELVKGRPRDRSQKNIRAFLEWRRATLAHNIFTCRSEVTIDGVTEELGDDALRRLRLEADALELATPRSFFDDVLLDLAQRNGYHPVREYLDNLVWDGVPRLNTWLSTYAGAPNTELTRAIGRKTLIAAVSRVRRPGCKFDTALVLEGPQGLGKSSQLRTLCGDAWFDDNLHVGADPKQIIEQTAGKWIVEMAELSGIKRSEVEAVKTMLSRQSDRARLSYGRHAVDRPRQFILVGTVNEPRYLKDTTGNRRFWPVKTGTLVQDALARDRDQLWAEAAYEEARGESLVLPKELWADAAAEQAQRMLDDPWLEILKPKLEGKTGTAHIPHSIRALLRSTTARRIG